MAVCSSDSWKVSRRKRKTRTPAGSAANSRPCGPRPMSNCAWRTCSPLTWREYHQSTKHSAESLWRTPHVLDWDSMPHPFRYYEGAVSFELPPDPPAPESPALAVLQRQFAASSGCAEGAQFLSRLLFHS